MPDEAIPANEDEIIDVPQDETLTTEETTEAIESPEVQEVVEVESEPEPSQEDEDEDDGAYNPLDGFYKTPDIEVPNLDLSQIPVDENGIADVNALAQLINSQVAAATQAAVSKSTALVNELEEKRREELLWQKAVEKNPQLKDKQYAKEVQALRYGLFTSDVMGGTENAKMLTPAQADALYQKRLGAVQAQAAKTATENVRVQESAYIEPTSGAVSNAKASEDALFEKMRSSDRAESQNAAHEFLMKRLFGDN